jgi:hypothetical protein
VESRLPTPRRANLNAVIRYGDHKATGLLVYGTPGKHATGLILTNQHAVAAHPHAEIVFADGKQATPLRLVAQSLELDYALVEVALPTDTIARAARLRGSPIRARERVYSLSMTTNPLAIPMSLAVTTVHGRERAIRSWASSGAMRTLQEGVEIGGGREHDMPIVGEAHTVASYAFELPNAPGMSGSGVFSAGTHELVALHWGGNHDPRRWESVAVPSRRILHDLALKLHARAVPEDVRHLLKSLLDEAARP